MFINNYLYNEARRFVPGRCKKSVQHHVKFYEKSNELQRKTNRKNQNKTNKKKMI